MTASLEPRPYPLTHTQRFAALIIAELQVRWGRGPTLAELTHELDLKHKNQASRLVASLDERGWLQHRTRRVPIELKPVALAMLAPFVSEECAVEITDLGRREIAAREVS